MTTCIKKQRNSNLELYRIIVMLSIVAHHYVVNSGLVGGVIDEQYVSANSLFYWLFGMWGKTGINCCSLHIYGLQHDRLH